MAPIFCKNKTRGPSPGQNRRLQAFHLHHQGEDKITSAQKRTEQERDPMPFASYLCSSCISFFFILVRLLNGCFGGDPYVFYDWTISFITASPLGDKQQVIGINGQFPGPILNVTTNWNVVVNAKNDLDEPLLLTWTGVQHRKNSWQDGVLGANCPIPADFQRAAGGYGGIIINNRDVIPLPFAVPDVDITIFISDWYTKSHKKLRKDVENGVDLGVPDGILINGLGPYRYDAAIVPDSIPYQLVNIEPEIKLREFTLLVPHQLWMQVEQFYLHLSWPFSGRNSLMEDKCRDIREMSWMVVNVETEKMVSCYEDEVGFKIPSDI
ncbi:hypothetical protein CUMW_135920 [Citrus unshiu]|nr:hypothetical protein CUMW_135920 [Citrus unshiu]